MLPIVGALAKSAGSYYINPIKTSYGKLVTEKGLVKKVDNVFDLSVNVTAPYISGAASLGKTPLTKTVYGTTAALIPVKDDIVDAYNVVKKKLDNKDKQVIMQNFGTTGAVAGSILGGMFMGTPGMVIGGIVGDTMQNKRQKKKEKAKNIMNNYLTNGELTNEDLINIYMD